MKASAGAILRAAAAVVLLALATSACGPSQAVSKPESTSQKAHMAIAKLNSLTPLQEAVRLCMHGIFGAARDESVKGALDELFKEQTGKNVAGGVFTGFEIIGDTVKITNDLGHGQVFSAEFDLGRVLFAVFGSVPELKLFGMIGQPAIDCTEAAFWLDGTLGGQLGALIRSKLQHLPDVTPTLDSFPSSLSGDYTLARHRVSCTGFSSCYLNPMQLHIACTGLGCSIIRTNNAPGYPPWNKAIPLVFQDGAWHASGSELYAVGPCNGHYTPAAVSFTLKVASGQPVDGVWKAQKLTGTYSFSQGSTACGSALSATEILSGGPTGT